MATPPGGKRTDLSLRFNLTGPMSGASWMTPGAVFSPGQSLQPITPDQQPRAWDFPVNVNSRITPRIGEPFSFAELKAFANVELVRMAIETRKDQFERLDWQIKPTDEKKLRALKAGAEDARITAMTRFWRKPDQVTPFASWIRELLDNLLVLDAPALFCQRTRGGGGYSGMGKVGKLLGLEVIPGETIEPKVDDTGRRPRLPTDVAYQQVIKGVGWVDLANSDLIYAPRNMRPNHHYGFCYDAETEILTRRGFVRFADLCISDDVATRNPASKAFEWQRPTHHTAEPYVGDMYRFHSKTLDLLVTPQHRMLVTALPRTLGGNGRRKGEIVVSAEELAGAYNRSVKIPMTSTWDGVEIGEQVFELAEFSEPIKVRRVRANGKVDEYLQTRRSGPSEAVRIGGDDFAQLMGSYLADGNVRSQGGIEIANHEGNKAFADMAALIARIQRGPAQHTGKAFILPRKPLTDYFRQFGHAHEKFIPDIVMNAPVRQLRLFWDAFVRSDGCFEARPNISGRGEGPGFGTRITTTSRRMADQLVEIAQKLGWSAAVRTRPAGEATILGVHCKTREAYIVSLRHSKAMGFSAVKTTYDGMIHCVTVPNGIVYVRRNGKPAWCGNSPVEQIIVTINTLIQRQARQLAYFTEGNLPSGFLTGPEGWNPDQVAQMQAWLDSMVSGQTAEQSKLRFMPGGTKYQAFKDSPLKDDFDEWLARLVAYAFSLPPTPFIKQMNRSTGETDADRAQEEGLEPLKLWAKRLIDGVIQDDFGFDDLEFAWVDTPSIDPKIQAEIDDRNLRNGSSTIDEVRDARGDDPLPDGQGAKALIYVGAGAMTVEQVLKAAEDAVNPVMPPSPVADNMAPAPGQAEPGQPAASGEAEPAPKPAAQPSPKPKGGKPADDHAGKASVIADLFKAAAPIKADRPLGRRLAASLKLALTPILSRTGDHVAADVGRKLRGLHKAADDGAAAANAALAAKLAAEVDLSELDAVSDAVYDDLFAITFDSAQQAMAQIGVKAESDLMDQVHQRAVDYAKARGAQLVSVDGDKNIVDATRRQIADVIANGLADNIGSDKIAEALQESQAFSKARAELIAKTEITFANAAGKKEGWDRGKDDGLVMVKGWQTSNDDGVEEICEANEAEGEIPYDQDFSSGDFMEPAHVGCRCVCYVSASLPDDSGADDGEDAEA
jgi:hypothetical protein